MRKILSILLSVTIILSCMGMMSFAEDTNEFVIDSLESYVVYEAELTDDGHIGIPVGVKTYIKEATDSSTPLIIYVVGTNTERVGTKSDEELVESFLDRGYGVVVLNYYNNEKSVSPDLDISIQGIKTKIRSTSGMKTYLAGNTTSTDYVYILPAGYDILRQEPFWSIDQHGTAGCFDFIISVWNNDFLGIKKNKTITFKNDLVLSEDLTYTAGTTMTVGEYTASLPGGKVTDISQCIAPDGSPIEMNLYMDVIYPAKAETEVPVMMYAQSGQNTVGTWNTNQRPHVTGFLLDGYAVALYDFPYVPMARTDHYGYFDGNGNGGAGWVSGDNYTYSLGNQASVKSGEAAVRMVRYLADQNPEEYNFNKDKYGVIGISKTGNAIRLGYKEDNKRLNEERIFDEQYGATRYELGQTEDIKDYSGNVLIRGGEEQPWLNYSDGTAIASNVQFSSTAVGSAQDKVTYGNAPMYIYGTMLSGGSMWNYYPDLMSRAYSHDIPTMDYVSDNLGHSLIYGKDYYTGNDAYFALFECADYWLKDEGVKLEWIKPYNGDINILPTDVITVRFNAPVSEDEIKKVTIVNSQTGKAASGTWSASYGRTKWEFTPDYLDGGCVYTVAVPKTLVGENGKPVKNPSSSSFTVIREKGVLKEINSDATSENAVLVSFDGTDFSSSTTTGLRINVANDAANIAEIYSASSDGTIGELLGSVNLDGAGNYEIDISDYIAKIEDGESAYFAVKAKKVSGESVILSENFDDDAIGDDGNYAITNVYDHTTGSGNSKTPTTQELVTKFMPYHQYYSGTQTLSSFYVFNTIGEADYGRKFKVSFCIYDTQQRMINADVGSTTVGKVNDYEGIRYAFDTEANTWKTYEFDYRLNNENYMSKNSLTISAEAFGAANAEHPVYIDDVSITETVTDISLASATLVLHPADSVSINPINATFVESGAGADASFEEEASLKVSGRSKSANSSDNKKVYAEIDLSDYNQNSENIVTITVSDGSSGTMNVYGVKTSVDVEAANYINSAGNDRFGAGANEDETQFITSLDINGDGDYKIDVSDYAEYMTKAGYTKGYLLFVPASDESSAFSAAEDFDDGKINYTQLQGGEILTVTDNPKVTDEEDLYGNGKSLKVAFVATYDRIYIDFLGAESITEDDIGRTFTMSYWYKADKASTLENALRQLSSNTTEQVKKFAYTTPGEWARVTYDFEITKTAFDSGILYLDFRCAIADNVAYFDNIVVKETNVGAINFGFKQNEFKTEGYYYKSDIESDALVTVSATNPTSGIANDKVDEITQEGIAVGINGFGVAEKDGVKYTEVYEITDKENHSISAGAEKSLHFSVYNNYPRVFVYNMFDTQTASELTAGDEYVISFRLKASRAGKFNTSITNVSDQGTAYNTVTHTVSEANVGKWVKYTYPVTVTEDMIENNKAILKITEWKFSQSTYGLADVWIDDIESYSAAGVIEEEVLYSYSNSFTAKDDGYLYGGFHGNTDEDGNLVKNEYGTYFDINYTTNVNRGVEDTTSGSLEIGVESNSNRVFLTNIVDSMTADDVGRKFEVSFYLKSDTAGSMNMSMSHNTFGGNAYSGESKQSITISADEVGTWKKCVFSFTITEEMVNASANGKTAAANMLYLRVNEFLSSTATSAMLYIDDVKSVEIADGEDAFSYSNNFTAMNDGYLFGGYHGNTDEDGNLIYNQYGTWADIYYNPNVNRGATDTASGAIETIVTSSSNRIFLTDIVDSVTADDVGRKFRVSFWVKSDTAGSVNMSMSKTTLSGLDYTGVVKKTLTINEDEINTWKKIVFEFTVTEEMVNAAVNGKTGPADQLMIYVGNIIKGSVTSVTMHIDDVKSVEITGEKDIYAETVKTISPAKLTSGKITVYSGEESDTAEKVRKAYLRFEKRDYQNSQGATLNIDVTSANGQKITLYGLVNKSWPEGDVTYNTAPGAGIDEKMTEGGAPLGEAILTESGIYGFDVSDYVKNQGEADCIFVLTSDAAGGTEYINIDFETQNMLTDIDYKADSAVTLSDGSASVAGNKITLLNAFGNANKAIKAGEQYTISADVTATGDTVIGISTADGTVSESASYSLSGESQRISLVYTATEEDEANGICAVSIESANAGFNVDNISVSSENVVEIAKNAELVVKDAKEPDVDSVDTVTISVLTSGGDYVVINGDNMGATVTKSVYTGTALNLSAEGDGTFLYWIDSNSKTILSYEEEFSYTVGTGRSIAAVYADDADVFVTFISNANTLVAAGIASTLEVVPDNPYIYGYKFDSWYVKGGSKTSMKAGDAIEVSENTEFVAAFTKDNSEYKVTVDGTEETHAYNEKVTYAAEAEKDGKTFSYWKRDGEIVSYNANYSFYVNGNTTLESVYGEAASGGIVLAMAKPVLVDGSKIAFFAERDIPEKYTLIESGILVGTEEGLNIDNASVRAIAKSASNKGQYTIRKTGLVSGTIYYGAAYAIYRDESGSVITAYSNEVSYTVE